MRKRYCQWLLAGILLGLQIVIDLYREEWMAALLPLNNWIPGLARLSIRNEPFVLSVGFTLLRAGIYTYLLEVITRSKSYARLFFFLHVSLFALGTFLYLVSKTFGLVPARLNHTLFFITNTPFLFLASVPAYYYLFAPAHPKQH